MTDRSKLERFLWGAIWAALGGLQPALLDIAHDWYAYKPPLDWQHIGFMTAGGVIMGLAGYWQQQKALFTPAPALAEPAGSEGTACSERLATSRPA